MTDEAACLQREVASLGESSGRLQEAGHGMTDELSAMRQYCDLLHLQNCDLEKELDEFVRTEEMLKQHLERRTRTEKLAWKQQREPSQLLVARDWKSCPSEKENVPRSYEKLGRQSPLRHKTLL